MEVSAETIGATVAIIGGIATVVGNFYYTKVKSDETRIRLDELKVELKTEVDILKVQVARHDTALAVTTLDITYIKEGIKYIKDFIEGKGK